MRPVYVIEDVAGNTMFKISGDICYCKCCDDVMFNVSTVICFLQKLPLIIHVHTKIMYMYFR